ncbi:MAG TPA: hypothetical protein VHQ47_15950 [Phycisphaerae bacterium]|jgi:hypothetical protein|nr:hypothetical protein [Phycisphaerae bacterium]
MRTRKPAARKPEPETRAANPAEFCKKTTAVRERMARALKETPPEERIKRSG